MSSLSAHVLRFQGQVATPLLLNEHKGSAIRGALFHSLRHRWCVRQELTSCTPCDLHQVCPISALLATVDGDNPRGIDVPRPFTVEPPLDGRLRYQAGKAFEFGITVFGEGLRLLPYALQAVHDLATSGLGRRAAQARGTVRMDTIEAVNPLTGERQRLQSAGDAMIGVPSIPVTHEQVNAAAAAHGDRVTVEFLSPTRLTSQGHLVRQPVFGVLFQRLAERLRALSAHYASEPIELGTDLLRLADQVRLVDDRTRWADWESYSTRRQAATPMGGFVGQATYAGDLRPLLAWLIWGSFTHVGKDATKGNGWYRLLPA